MTAEKLWRQLKDITDINQGGWAFTIQHPTRPELVGCSSLISLEEAEEMCARVTAVLAEAGLYCESSIIAPDGTVDHEHHAPKFYPASSDPSMN